MSGKPSLNITQYSTELKKMFYNLSTNVEINSKNLISKHKNAYNQNWKACKLK